MDTSPLTDLAICLASDMSECADATGEIDRVMVY